MDKSSDIIQILRDKQLSWGLRAFSIVGFLTFFILIFRVFTIGWHPQIILHSILLVILVGAAILNRHLSFLFRASILAAILLVIAISGFMTWGLGSMGLQALLALCIISTITFSYKAGIFSFLLSIIIIALFGFLIGSGIITIKFNLHSYLSTYTAWLLALFTMILSGGLIVIALANMHKEIDTLLITLNDRNKEMAKVIHQLEEEVFQRRKAEEDKFKLEDRLLKSQRIEYVGTLAGGVAHDLNNILVGSVTYPDLILLQLSQNSRLRKPIEKIRQSGMKAAAIVQDLLTLTRRGVISFDVVNLNDVISDYFTSLEYKKLKSFHEGLEIDIKLGKDLPNILGSPIHLLKTAMNLVLLQDMRGLLQKLANTDLLKKMSM